MSVGRRSTLLMAVITVALLAAGGTALAATITGNDNANNIVGTSANDTLDGRGGNDKIQGMVGSDKIYGGNGADQLFGADEEQGELGGNDSIYGQYGNDTIEGSAGADTLSGGSANDIIIEGPQGDDAVDTINGGDGDDVIYAGNGSGTTDVITCGAGRDEVRADPVDNVAADCETMLPNPVEQVHYDTSTATSGEIIPASSEHPEGTEIGGITVQDTDSNGNVIATYSETWVAGEPDQHTMVDEMREGSEISPAHSGGRTVSCYKPVYRGTDLLYRFYVYKHWHWSGGKVHSPNAWRDFQIYDPITSYRRIVSKRHGYRAGASWHFSYRKAHFYHEPFHPIPARHSYPWVQVWGSGYGGYDCSVGKG